MRKVSKLVTPAAVESLPRLVAALCGSEYLSEVMDAVQEAYYQRHPKPSDPEEEELSVGSDDGELELPGF